MYVMLPGSQNLGRITTQDHSIMAGKLQKNRFIVIFSRAKVQHIIG